MPSRVAMSSSESPASNAFVARSAVVATSAITRASPASIRATNRAPSSLNWMSLIGSRPKIGSRVEPRERWNLLDRDVLGWYGAAMDAEKFLLSIQQMRRIVEPEAAALAARNHTAKQMKAIEEAMEDMRSLTTHQEIVAADVRFHLAILAAAGNEFLVPFGFLIDSALASVFDYTRRRNDDPYYALPLHEAIVAAIRRRNPEQARLAAKRLLSDTDSVIERSRRSLHRQAPRRKPRAARANETSQGT